MTTYDHRGPMGATGLPQPSRWVCVLLGLFMVFAGLMVLGDVAFFTVVSALFIGWMAIATGLFEVFHAFWTKGWGGFVWQVCSAFSTSPLASFSSASR